MVWRNNYCMCISNIIKSSYFVYYKQYMIIMWQPFKFKYIVNVWVFMWMCKIKDTIHIHWNLKSPHYMQFSNMNMLWSLI